MEANKEEALKAIDNAEKLFSQRDFAGAKSYAVKAKTLCPGLEGISQIVNTFEVYIASEVTHYGELYYYSILRLKPSANTQVVKRQYKKLAVLLHPNKKKCVGADGAFKLVSEAWTWVSDSAMHNSYAIKRNAQFGGINQKSMSFGQFAPLARFSMSICASILVKNFHVRTAVALLLLWKLEQPWQIVRSHIVLLHICKEMGMGAIHMMEFHFSGTLLELSVKVDQLPYLLVLFTRPTEMRRGEGPKSNLVLMEGITWLRPWSI